MVKTKEVTKKVTRKIHGIYCDDCGKRIHWDLQCSTTRCEYCKADLCEKCVAQEDYADGDYRIVYCAKCWDIVKPIKEKIIALEDEIDRLEKECIAKCGKRKKYVAVLVADKE